MSRLPSYEVRVYHNGDDLSPEAEELLSDQLASSRKVLPPDRPDRKSWHFVLTCAVGEEDHVFGGVHLDIGPINGAGRLSQRLPAYLERTLIREQYRRQGTATAPLKCAIAVAQEAGCEYNRCSADWDKEAETALLRKCGFALIDLNGENDEEPCYFAARPVRNLEV